MHVIVLNVVKLGVVAHLQNKEEERWDFWPNKICPRINLRQRQHERSILR
jgi:hypothetical protein